MRPATPAVMGRNLAVPCGNRRRSQGNDSNEQHPRVVEAQQANAGVGTNPDKEKRPRRTDFSDALRKRGIEEVNAPWRARR